MAAVLSPDSNDAERGRRSEVPDRCCEDPGARVPRQNALAPTLIRHMEASKSARKLGCIVYSKHAYTMSSV
jgi:hypothetical protein